MKEQLEKREKLDNQNLTREEIIVMALSLHWMDSWGFDWDTDVLSGGGGRGVATMSWEKKRSLAT